jgi:hypothetical protein
VSFQSRIGLRRVLTVIAFLALIKAVRGGEASPPDVIEAPVYDQFIVVPLRIHLLKSEDLSEVDCHLTDSDVKRILGKVNGVWHKAGIHWGLESLRREPAARQGRFRAARDLGGADNLGLFRVLFPDDSHAFDGIHVYYIHKFAVNGVWLGDNAAVVQDTAKLRSVPGGIDEPIPRVTAHELGHALGLPHRQNTTNLLASGTTGTLLNTEEVAKARDRAQRVKGARIVSALQAAAKEAMEKKEPEKARLLWSWLAEIPGDGATAARKQLEALKAAPK